MSSGNMNIEGIAVKMFGNYFLQRKAKFSSLSEDLLKARLYTRELNFAFRCKK